MKGMECAKTSKTIVKQKTAHFSVNKELHNDFLVVLTLWLFTSCLLPGWVFLLPVCFLVGLFTSCLLPGWAVYFLVGLSTSCLLPGGVDHAAHVEDAAGLLVEDQEEERRV